MTAWAADRELFHILWGAWAPFGCNWSAAGSVWHPLGHHLDSFGGNTGAGVGAGKIDDEGFGNDDIGSVATGAAVGRMGGGIPGGGGGGGSAVKATLAMAQNSAYHPF